MSLLSDLVLESKLETTFLPNYTQHTYYKRGTSGEKRRIQVRERWKRQKRLGQGAYGSVWLETCSRPAKQDGPKVRAVKEIPIDLRTRSAIDCHRELEAVMKFSQARYVSSFVHSFGWFESPDTTFIAMEYVENGDLQTYLNDPIPEEEAKMIAYQLADGLNHMHQNGFAHRDLKPGNILVVSKGPQWLVQISDFGISKRLRPEQATLGTIRMGTLGFIAPEMLGFIPGRDCPYAVDIWSLGAVIFRMLANELFLADLDLIRNYAVGLHLFPVERLAPFQVKDSMKDLLRQLLAPNPKKRPSTSEVMHHESLMDVAGKGDISDNSEWGDYSNLSQTDSEACYSKGEETDGPPSATWSTDIGLGAFTDTTIRPNKTTPREAKPCLPIGGSKDTDRPHSDIQRTPSTLPTVLSISTRHIVEGPVIGLLPASDTSQTESPKPEAVIRSVPYVLEEGEPKALTVPSSGGFEIDQRRIRTLHRSMTKNKGANSTEKTNTTSSVTLDSVDNENHELRPADHHRSAETKRSEPVPTASQIVNEADEGNVVKEVVPTRPSNTSMPHTNDPSGVVQGTLSNLSSTSHSKKAIEFMRHITGSFGPGRIPPLPRSTSMDADQAPVKTPAKRQTSKRPELDVSKPPTESRNFSRAQPRIETRYQEHSSHHRTASRSPSRPHSVEDSSPRTKSPDVASALHSAGPSHVPKTGSHHRKSSSSDTSRTAAEPSDSSYCLGDPKTFQEPETPCEYEHTTSWGAQNYPLENVVAWLTSVSSDTDYDPGSYEEFLRQNGRGLHPARMSTDFPVRGRERFYPSPHDAEMVHRVKHLGPKFNLVTICKWFTNCDDFYRRIRQAPIKLHCLNLQQLVTTLVSLHDAMTSLQLYNAFLPTSTLEIDAQEKLASFIKIGQSLVCEFWTFVDTGSKVLAKKKVNREEDIYETGRVLLMVLSEQKEMLHFLRKTEDFCAAFERDVCGTEARD